jgi:hypothetical protein
MSTQGYSRESFKKIEAWVSDDRIRERLHFLISLVPTLTAGGALKWLESSGDGTDEDRSRLWFHSMLSKKDNGRKIIETATQANPSACEIHPSAMMQLSFALNAFLGKRKGSG